MMPSDMDLVLIHHVEIHNQEQAVPSNITNMLEGGHYLGEGRESRSSVLEISGGTNFE